MIATPVLQRLWLHYLKPRSAVCLAGAALLVAGCQPPPTARTPLYAVDFTGAAKSCKTSSVDLSGGKSAQATMAVVNDGGWCGILVSQNAAPSRSDRGAWAALGASTAPARRPFAAGLLQTRAQHGRVYVHAVGDETRIDYTPDAGFTGNDQFAVRLLPGNPVLTVAVTVSGK